MSVYLHSFQQRRFHGEGDLLGRVIGWRETEATLNPSSSGDVLPAMGHSLSCGNPAYCQRGVVVGSLSYVQPWVPVRLSRVTQTQSTSFYMGSLFSSLKILLVPSLIPAKASQSFHWFLGWSRPKQLVCRGYSWGAEMVWERGSALSGFTSTPPAHLRTQSLSKNSMVAMKIASKKVPYFPFLIRLLPWKGGSFKGFQGTSVSLVVRSWARLTGARDNCLCLWGCGTYLCHSALRTSFSAEPQSAVARASPQHCP